MRKIAAHYWLRPDASIGRFPIISFNEDCEIVEIRERDVFEEEPSLELINGLLVPGFIDFYTLPLLGTQDQDIQRYLNRCIIAGVKVLAVPEDRIKRALAANVSGSVFLHSIEKDGYIEGEGLGFEKIQNADDSLHQLKQLGMQNAKFLGVDYLFGSLELGKKPGLLAISNLNYQTFTISENSKLKIVI